LEHADRCRGARPGRAVEQAAHTIGADRVAAVDPSPAFVEMVSRRVPGADVRIAGAENLPFDDQSFTAIYSIASMHHWDDRSAGLAELASKLAPGGRLLIAERLLRRPGHGITSEQLSEVENALKNLGQIEVRTVVRPAGRRRLAILCSNRPTDPSPGL
jgi:ubiquinone/menaquinone biosynthesis C-methylase UbiE